MTWKENGRNQNFALSFPCHYWTGLTTIIRGVICVTISICIMKFRDGTKSHFHNTKQASTILYCLKKFHNMGCSNHFNQLPQNEERNVLETMSPLCKIPVKSSSLSSAWIKPVMTPGSLWLFLSQRLVQDSPDDGGEEEKGASECQNVKNIVK